MIYIIDYKSGNLGAIQNMLKKIGAKAQIASAPDQLKDATKIMLPGVGTFDTGMQSLRNGGWMDILNEKVFKEKVPTIGICLGMQLLTKGSEEGKLEGLGWINGHTKRFNLDNASYKVPHMGWNVAQPSKPSKLIGNDTDEKRFYFAHSYYVSVEDRNDELLSTNYGIQFTSAVEKDNIMGVQFHPEKSHRFGMALLKNFVTNF